MSIRGHPRTQRPAGSKAQETTRKQIRGSSLLLVGRFVSLGVNFVVQILIVRYLTQGGLRRVRLRALAGRASAQSIVTFGLDRAITRFIPIYEERRGVRQGLRARSSWSLGTILVPRPRARASLVYGLQGSSRRLARIGDRAGRRRSSSSSSSSSRSRRSTACSMGMFAVFSKPRAIFFRKYVLAPASGSTVVLLLVFGEPERRLARRRVRRSPAPAGVGALQRHALPRAAEATGCSSTSTSRRCKMPAREVFGFTIPLLASDLLYMVMNTSDVILLGHFGGAADVGALRVVMAGRADEPARHGRASRLLFTPLAARMFAREDTRGSTTSTGGQRSGSRSSPSRSSRSPSRSPAGDRRRSTARATRTRRTYLALLSFALLLQCGTRLQRPDAEGLRQVRYIVSSTSWPRS